MEKPKLVKVGIYELPTLQHAKLIAFENGVSQMIKSEITSEQKSHSKTFAYQHGLQQQRQFPKISMFRYNPKLITPHPACISPPPPPPPPSPSFPKRRPGLPLPQKIRPVAEIELKSKKDTGNQNLSLNLYDERERKNFLDELQKCLAKKFVSES